MYLMLKFRKTRFRKVFSGVQTLKKIDETWIFIFFVNRQFVFFSNSFVWLYSYHNYIL